MTQQERRQYHADKAAFYVSGSSMLADAKHQGTMIYGWLQGRFIRVYPGGRSEDLTQFVTMRPAIRFLTEEEQRMGKRGDR